MIRFKAGAPRGVPPRSAPGGAALFRLPVRARPAVRYDERHPLRRVLTLAVPTAWGATAVAYRMACPLAHDGALGSRLISSAVMCVIGTGLIVHVRRREKKKKKKKKVR
ncbi:hypothetical protein ACPF8X_39400 [Streptomyces sp. G35A]